MNNRIERGIKQLLNIGKGQKSNAHCNSYIKRGMLQQLENGKRLKRGLVKERVVKVESLKHPHIKKGSV